MTGSGSDSRSPSRFLPLRPVSARFEPMMISTSRTGNRTMPAHQRCSYFMCMKNMTTSDALTVAIRRPTATLPQCPKCTWEAATVRAVPTARAARTLTYVLLWSSADMAPPSVEQVDEVPVQRQVLDVRVMVLVEALHVERAPDEKDDADQHVDPVEPGHQEVAAVEDVGVGPDAVGELERVLVHLHAQEERPQGGRGDHEVFALAAQPLGDRLHGLHH